METLSADLTLKPSLLRAFLGDTLIFLSAYALMLLSRSMQASFWFLPEQTGQWIILLAAGLLGCLLVGALDCEKAVIRLANGRLEGRAPFSWKPVGFPLARLDRQRTRESLKAASPWNMKGAFLWSIDGERIVFKAKAFEPGEVGAFIHLLGI